MEKILTVSIAAFNVENTLNDALIPFTKCKYKDMLEILIISDGSTDNTANIAKQFVDKYPNTFRLIEKENGGWGSTLNKGMELGQGKYFKQLDGDDYFSGDNLDEFLTFLQQTEADMVYSPFVTYEDKSGAILREIGVYDNIPYKVTMPLKEIKNFAPAMHTLTIRMEILKENNIEITEHCFYTDVEFVLKCCNYCNNVTFFDLPIYYYRLARSGQSMSIGGVRKHYEDHLKMLKKMLDYELQEVKRQEIIDIFHIRLNSACEMQYIFFLALQCNAKQRLQLRLFDKDLKDNYPYYYNLISNGAVQFLRKTNFHGYKIVGHLQTLRDKRKKINIFEGC